MAEMSWAALQCAALDGAHPAWFRPMGEQLVAHARQSREGRRLLARSLVGRPAPVLFGSYPASVPQALANQHWMLLPATVLDELALDLGAAAFAPAIRLRVARADVLRLRRALGQRRYADILGSQHQGDGATGEISAALDLAMAGDEQLVSALRWRGWAEWLDFVQPQHPVLAERLRLAVAPERPTATRVRWLSPAMIATHLAGARAAPQQEVAADGARSDH